MKERVIFWSVPMVLLTSFGAMLAIVLASGCSEPSKPVEQVNPPGEQTVERIDIMEGETLQAVRHLVECIDLESELPGEW